MMKISFDGLPPDCTGATGFTIRVPFRVHPPNCLDVIAVAVLRRLATHYAHLAPDVLNEQLDHIADWCQAARFEPVEEK